MKKSSLFSLLEMLFLIILCILNIFIFKIDNCLIISLILLIFGVLSYFFLGFEKSNYRNKRDVIYTLCINIVVYFIVTYLLGLVVGFLKNSYSLNIISIIKNLFPFLIFLIIREIFRYIYYNKAKNNKLLIVIGCILFVLIDICLYSKIYDVEKTDGLVRMICLIVFPSIAKNILLNYLTVNFGYESPILYSGVMELNKFILPIFPDFGEYIGTIIIVLFPLFIRSNIKNIMDFKEKRKIKSSRYRKNNIILYSFITLFLILIVMLTSGYFKYYAVTIGSSSMSPYISKGDVVIVKTLKQNKHDQIKINDILVYKYSGKIIVHRLVETKMLAGKKYYITKGDSNITNDGYFVSDEDIIGVVGFKIKYIGYPTVSLNERISKE